MPERQAGTRPSGGDGRFRLRGIHSPDRGGHFWADDGRLCWTRARGVRTPAQQVYFTCSVRHRRGCSSVYFVDARVVGLAKYPTRHKAGAASIRREFLGASGLEGEITLATFDAAGAG